MIDTFDWKAVDEAVKPTLIIADEISEGISLTREREAYRARTQEHLKRLRAVALPGDPNAWRDFIDAALAVVCGGWNDPVLTTSLRTRLRSVISNMVLHQMAGRASHRMRIHLSHHICYDVYPDGRLVGPQNVDQLAT